jgi:hypothetical protein
MFSIKPTTMFIIEDKIVSMRSEYAIESKPKSYLTFQQSKE